MSLGVIIVRAGSAVAQRMSPTWAASERGVSSTRVVRRSSSGSRAGSRSRGSYRARRPAAFSPRCTRRSSTIRWCTSCSMLVHAAVASCWVVGSSTVAATPPSLSARRDSDRASRSSAVTAFAEGGSGRSTSSSVMPSVIPSIVLGVGQAAHDEPSSGNSWCVGGTRNGAGTGSPSTHGPGSTWRDAKPASVHHIGAAALADAGAISRTAAVGDRITAHGLHVGDATRCGAVLEVKGAGGEPPYVVRWWPSLIGLVAR